MLLKLNYIRLTLADFMTTNEVEIRSAFLLPKNQQEEKKCI